MPKLSPYRHKKLQKEKEMALDLYKEGLTMREIGTRLGRSASWVWNAVHELSTTPTQNKG